MPRRLRRRHRDRPQRDLRPGPDRRVSEWHCAVGTIRYDRGRSGDDRGPGTLLYIKSSLTGDEPADVLRYAAEHPAFPHESTNDQFFDESQFESYRALGYHIGRGRSSMRARARRTSAADGLQPVEIFTLAAAALGQAGAGAARRGAAGTPAALDSHLDACCAPRKNLTFLDGQMFPEMPALMACRRTRCRAANRRRRRGRPPSTTGCRRARTSAARASTSACEMLQLMEDVFLDFDLDQHYDHIDNRGWMNLFQHWAWSGMLCATWAMTGSTFDPRFQRFCWTRLDLRPGTPGVAGLQDAVPLPDPAQWRAWRMAAEAAGRRRPDLKAARGSWQAAPA